MTLIDKKIINRNASLNKKKIPQYARGKQDSVRCIVISCNLIKQKPATRYQKNTYYLFTEGAKIT